MATASKSEQQQSEQSDTRGEVDKHRPYRAAIEWTGYPSLGDDDAVAWALVDNAGARVAIVVNRDPAGKSLSATLFNLDENWPIFRVLDEAPDEASSEHVYWMTDRRRESYRRLVAAASTTLDIEIDRTPTGRPYEARLVDTGTGEVLLQFLVVYGALED